MQDLDAVDLLHRLDALAHDALDPVEQAATEQAVARAIREHIFRLVEQALRFRFHGAAHLLGLGGDAGFLGGLLGHHHFHGLPALGGFALAHGLDLLGGLHGLGLGDFGLHGGGTLLQRLGVERDGLFHRRVLDIALALDLEFAQVALATDTASSRPRSDAMRARSTSSLEAICAS